MTENEAWTVVQGYARQAGLTLQTTMTISVLRRTLAKKYQPRRAGDDDEAMRRINRAIDVIDAERDRRELYGLDPFAAPAGTSTTGSSNPGPTSTYGGSSTGSYGSGGSTGGRTGPGPGSASGGWTGGWSSGAGQKSSAGGAALPPWQTEPGDSCEIQEYAFSDVNFIKKTIYERSARMGGAELVKAWAWDGSRFRKVISAFANEFAYEELGRAMVYWQSHADESVRCDAVLLTRGAGRATHFRLIIIRIGKGFEDVSRYGWS
ncbi:MAG: hypothetical protein ACRC1K_08040, partial [Planctomycetia bacterium]